jgi:hypothetical protein
MYSVISLFQPHKKQRTPQGEEAATTQQQHTHQKMQLQSRVPAGCPARCPRNGQRVSRSRASLRCRAANNLDLVDPITGAQRNSLALCLESSERHGRGTVQLCSLSVQPPTCLLPAHCRRGHQSDQCAEQGSWLQRGRGGCQVGVPQVRPRRRKGQPRQAVSAAAAWPGLIQLWLQVRRPQPAATAVVPAQPQYEVPHVCAAAGHHRQTRHCCCFTHTCRRTLAMLGEAGYDAIAPDWPGHGESGKPSGSSFNYSQQAYLDGLAGFVQAVGIKTPFALVVQVRKKHCGTERPAAPATGQLRLAQHTVDERPANGCGSPNSCQPHSSCHHALGSQSTQQPRFATCEQQLSSAVSLYPGVTLPSPCPACRVLCWGSTGCCMRWSMKTRWSGCSSSTPPWHSTASCGQSWLLTNHHSPSCGLAT